MRTTRTTRGSDGKWHVSTQLRGPFILNHPLLNRGTAFTPEQRRMFALEGLLPPAVSKLEDQAIRAYDHLHSKHDDIEKYIGLAGLQDRNETLFYRVLVDHLEELMPLVYTPTVGEAIVRFSKIYRRPRGIWITPDHRGRIADILRNAPHPHVRLIVVTDNERILGLGDQGAGGIGIPIGKLALYVAAAGIHPSEALPISLDVGTDNEELLNEPLYVGWRKPRLRGEAYATLVEEFVAAVKEVFPEALLQWEDFKKQTAFDNLDKYRDALPSFNDDIEGTAAVAVAGIVAATRVTKIPVAAQRIVILGAGAAGVGIARLIRDELTRHGVTGDELWKAVALVDSRGPLIADRTFRDIYKKEQAWPVELAKSAGLTENMDLEGVIKALKPTVLIGTTGVPNSFPQAAIEAMAAAVERPVIFPYSNPTSNAEAHPKDLLAWTKGRALVASGSPFGVVEYEGNKFRIGQGNNVYVFPGVGLGVLVARAKRVVPTMFAVAAEAIANATSDEDLAEGSLYPRQSRLREVTFQVAQAVVREAREQGVGRDIADHEIAEAVRQEMWEPSYPVLDLIETG